MNYLLGLLVYILVCLVLSLILLQISVQFVLCGCNSVLIWRDLDQDQDHQVGRSWPLNPVAPCFVQCIKEMHIMISSSICEIAFLFFLVFFPNLSAYLVFFRISDWRCRVCDASRRGKGQRGGREWMVLAEFWHVTHARVREKCLFTNHDSSKHEC